VDADSTPAAEPQADIPEPDEPSPDIQPDIPEPDIPEPDIPEPEPPKKRGPGRPPKAKSEAVAKVKPAPKVKTVPKAKPAPKKPAPPPAPRPSPRDVSYAHVPQAQPIIEPHDDPLSRLSSHELIAELLHRRQVCDRNRQRDLYRSWLLS
jgi:hypothetical protein